jgi:hypothetical protein
MKVCMVGIRSRPPWHSQKHPLRPEHSFISNGFLNAFVADVVPGRCGTETSFREEFMMKLFESPVMIHGRARNCFSKVHPRTGLKNTDREQRYSSTLSLISVKKGGRWLTTPRPLYPQGKGPLLTVQKSGWAPGPVWTGAENLTPGGTRSPRTSSS